MYGCLVEEISSFLVFRWTGVLVFGWRESNFSLLLDLSMGAWLKRCSLKSSTGPMCGCFVEEVSSV